MRIILLSISLAFFAVALIGCDGGGGGGEGGSGGSGGTGHEDLRPAQCKLERSGEECIACVADCCSACEDGSECLQYAACMHGCDGDIDCVTDCEDRFPDGWDDWMSADMCAVHDCGDVC